MEYNKFTVIIPTLNEENNIGKVIEILTKDYPKIKIIVSDDGSKDKTKEIVKKYHNTVFIDRTNQKTKGLTASVIDGILKTKTKFFIIMDGDLQHPPKKIKEISTALKNGKDLVICVRKKVVAPWPWHRRMISKAATLAGNLKLLLHNVQCKDIMSGFFGMKTKIAINIIKKNKKSFQMRGYKILFDLLKNMKNTAPYEIYYTFGLRNNGKSKMGSKVIYYYLKSLLS